MDKEKMEDELTKALELGENCQTLKERLLFFARHFKNGGIQTFLQGEEQKNNIFLARAVIHPDILNDRRAFTGYASGTDISVVEQKAILRAFTFMGVGTCDTIGEFDGKEGVPILTERTSLDPTTPSEA